MHLKAFRERYPSVSLRLPVKELGAVTQLVLKGTAMVGVNGPLAAEVTGIERMGVGSVELIPVASPRYPLATGGQPTLLSAIPMERV